MPRIWSQNCQKILDAVNGKRYDTQENLLMLVGDAIGVGPETARGYVKYLVQKNILSWDNGKIKVKA